MAKMVQIEGLAKVLQRIVRLETRIKDIEAMLAHPQKDIAIQTAKAVRLEKERDGLRQELEGIKQKIQAQAKNRRRIRKIARIVRARRR